MNMLEENKNLVREFFEAINRQDLARAEGMLSEQLSWWIIGRAKISGQKDRRSVRISFKMVFRGFDHFAFTLHDITAEGNRVAVTAESRGRHKSGKDYNNHYHFLFFIEDSQIMQVKEYFDTEHAMWLEAG